VTADRPKGQVVPRQIVYRDVPYPLTHDETICREGQPARRKRLISLFAPHIVGPSPRSEYSTGKERLHGQRATQWLTRDAPPTDILIVSIATSGLFRTPRKIRIRPDRYLPLPILQRPARDYRGHVRTLPWVSKEREASVADLMMRLPGATTAICGIAAMLLGGRRICTECKFVIESSAEHDAIGLHILLRGFVSEARILEIVGVRGTEGAVCQFKITSFNGLVIRGILCADVEQHAGRF
jgi:hypothetical protein